MRCALPPLIVISFFLFSLFSFLFLSSTSAKWITRLIFVSSSSRSIYAPRERERVVQSLFALLIERFP